METKKFQMVENNDAEIINLQQLQKLLLGKLTFDSIKELERLMKASFKVDVYEGAGAPPASTEQKNADSN